MPTAHPVNPVPQPEIPAAIKPLIQTSVFLKDIRLFIPLLYANTFWAEAPFVLLDFHFAHDPVPLHFPVLFKHFCNCKIIYVTPSSSCRSRVFLSSLLHRAIAARISSGVMSLIHHRAYAYRRRVAATVRTDGD